MGFYSGLFLGVAVGIGLVVCFARAHNLRSKRRTELAKVVAAFARMSVQDSKKILPPNLYPPWLGWLNLQLKKIWPFVDEAASELIRNNVEPILEQYRPSILASMKFSKLTLGTVAPQFTGVSIIEEESDSKGVTLELEMQWDGNPNITLDIKTRVGVALPIQVKDIAFTGVFRLIFKPLVAEFPAFGAVSYSLRHKKKLDFTLKVIGGDISSVPGIKDAIEETIKDAVEDSITWPVRKIVPILPGDYSDLELKPVGTLEVKLVQAKELLNMDMIGKSDPFVVLFIRPLRERTKRSKTIDNQLNPVWNEHFEFVVEDITTQNLTVKVYDEEGLQEAELIGCAHVALKDLEPGKVKDIWLTLVKDLEGHVDKKFRGRVHLELIYCPHGVQSSFTSSFDPDFTLTSLEKSLKKETVEQSIDQQKQSLRRRSNVFLRGVLSVTVISAEDLPPVDLNGKADPYVVLKLKKSETKVKTRVVNESLNPVWNQTFDFVVEDGNRDMLVLEVWDHDTFGKDKIGTVCMTLTRVMLEGEFQESIPLDGAKSGKLNLHMKWAGQPMFRDG